jgi:hypothetical protein
MFGLLQEVELQAENTTIAIDPASTPRYPAHERKDRCSLNPECLSHNKIARMSIAPVVRRGRLLVCFRGFRLLSRLRSPDSFRILQRKNFFAAPFFWRLTPLV